MAIESAGRLAGAIDLKQVNWVPKVAEVGGGPVALRRIGALLAARAEVALVSPTAVARVRLRAVALGWIR